MHKEAELDHSGHSVDYAETCTGESIRCRWVPQAQLLLRVFSVDVMSCPKCDNRLQRMTVIQQPSVLAAILDCLGRKEQPQ
jgi:hypothetical protein